MNRNAADACIGVRCAGKGGSGDAGHCGSEGRKAAHA
jgi:hypothetical protein